MSKIKIKEIKRSYRVISLTSGRVSTQSISPFISIAYIRSMVLMVFKCIFTFRTLFFFKIKAFAEVYIHNRSNLSFSGAGVRVLVAVLSDAPSSPPGDS